MLRLLGNLAPLPSQTSNTTLNLTEPKYNSQRWVAEEETRGEVALVMTTLSRHFALVYNF